MFELYFVITMMQGNIIQEHFEDMAFSTVKICQDEGWHKATKYFDEIVTRYPEMTNFQIDCKPLDRSNIGRIRI